MYHCEICGESGSFVREVESILCNAHAQMVGRTLNELKSQTGATVTVIKTPADAALAELLETVFQCEQAWRDDDRFDSFGRYGG